MSDGDRIGEWLVGHISLEKATDHGEFDAEDALKFYRWVEEHRTSPRGEAHEQ